MTSEPVRHPLDRGATTSHGYAPVNALHMYYEIEGTGTPLVYIPPALSDTPG